MTAQDVYESIPVGGSRMLARSGLLRPSSSSTRSYRSSKSSTIGGSCD